MKLRSLIVVVACCACCRAPEGARPEPAPTPSAAEPASSGSPPVPAGTDNEGSQTDAVLRAVLTHESFAMYLHPEVAGRVPVVVGGAALPTAPTLSLFDAPVAVAPSVGPDDAAVEVTAWTVEGDRATVVLRYAVEGVVGSFRLRRRDETWFVETADVAEH